MTAGGSAATRCPYCGAPASRGTVYRDSMDRDYSARDYQCGLPQRSPPDACGRTFRVQTGGAQCLGDDDICIDPTHDHIGKEEQA